VPRARRTGGIPLTDPTLYADLDPNELCRCGHAKLFHEPNCIDLTRKGYCNCHHFVPRGNCMTSTRTGSKRQTFPFVDNRPPKVNQ
jgi:hypothetical protein